MDLVTLSREPLGIWVNDYPVVVPFLDSVLAPSPDAFDLAEEWVTDLYFFKFVRNESYMVYLPENLREHVGWAGKRLDLC